MEGALWAFRIPIHAKNRQPLFFEQAAAYIATNIKVKHVLIQLFGIAWTACSRDCVLYVQLKPFWRSRISSKFARLVFEKRIVQRRLSPPRWGWRRRNHSLLTQCHMRSVTCTASRLLQRCIPIRGHGHYVAWNVSIDILLSLTIHVSRRYISFLCLSYHKQGRYATILMEWLEK